ncbi:hypothetical protein ACFFGH_31695 [Lysobacter korlensis]|uniref:DUF559 domain-containing protein n=1 Tax=Lysobacter korlensis TaxID=553636 RepID=A0ABV6RZK7_9GAMM
MTRRAPLPEGIEPERFLARDARAAGSTSDRLRAADLSRPFWGVRTARPAESTADRCRALALRLPAEGCFSHSTAAILFGAPLPSRLEGAPGLHVTVPRGQRAMDAAGVVGHQLTLSDSDVGTVLGLPVTKPARTWCDLASLLSLAELVAVGDHLLGRGAPLVSRHELAAASVRYASSRGARTRRAALPLLSARAESPAESRLRVLLVTAGYADLVVNEPVYDKAGRFLARPDLRFRHVPVILEYEGDHHRSDKAQWRKDIARVERLQSHGWHVVRVTADDLANPSALLRRLRSLLSQL